uniref:Cytochrome b6-f complex subunit 7 n=1 Tax=Leersia perrieri TaxID=77586 RepID=A0A0D9VZF0_9ORYZ
MASLSVATTLPSLAAAPAASRKKGGVTYVEGMNAYSGLKGLNKVTLLGVRMNADYKFAKVVAKLSPAGAGGKSRGGAFGATCNAAGEIFRIAVIMNGLTLVGVAVGFVLLRVEAAVEESE